MAQQTPYIGSKISLISKLDIRYEGILYTVDTHESTIALAKVRSFGTEDRPTPNPVMGRDDVYEYIIFKASDIKDLIVCETPKPIAQLSNGLPYDPAIITVSSGHSVPPMPAAPPQNVMSAGSSRSGTPAGRLSPINEAVAELSRAPAAGRTNQRGPPPQVPNAEAAKFRGGFNMQPPPLQPPLLQPPLMPPPLNDFGQMEELKDELLRLQLQLQQASLKGIGAPMNFNAQQQQQAQMLRGGAGGGMQRGHYHRGGGPNIFSQFPKGPHYGMTGRLLAPGQKINFESDYDFEKANEQFQQTLEHISEDLTKSKLEDGESETDSSIALLAGDQDDSSVENGTNQRATQHYDRSCSFFDRISCESLEKEEGKNTRTDWRKERETNQETFGHQAVRYYSNYRRGRGRHLGGRGGRGMAYRYNIGAGAYNNFGDGQQSRGGYGYPQNGQNKRGGGQRNPNP